MLPGVSVELSLSWQIISHLEKLIYSRFQRIYSNEKIANVNLKGYFYNIGHRIVSKIKIFVCNLTMRKDSPKYLHHKRYLKYYDVIENLVIVSLLEIFYNLAFTKCLLRSGSKK